MNLMFISQSAGHPGGDTLGTASLKGGYEDKDLHRSLIINDFLNHISDRSPLGGTSPNGKQVP